MRVVAATVYTLGALAAAISTGEVMAKSHTRARVRGTSPASSSHPAGVR